MLFQGEEWGASTPWQFFTSHPEPELGEATAKGRIGEFARMGWDESVVPDPQDPETFRRSKLDWSEASAGDHARLLELYRALARLRRERPELTDPSFASLGAELVGGEGTDAAHRAFRLGRGAVEILVNLTGGEMLFAVPKLSRVLLTTSARVHVAEGMLAVPPDAAVVVGPELRR